MHDFESLWATEGELVEEGNIKEKSGHSHVVRATLIIDGKSECVYIKKQTNYATALSRFLHRTASLCRREDSNITAWHRLGLPTMDVVYCGEVQNPLRGILVTRALMDYQSLDNYLALANLEQRHDILQKTAALIRRIHQIGWVHRCFYPKHVFVSPDNAVPLKMIDLEKARRAWLSLHDYARDLNAFDRRMDWRNDQERTLFFDLYFGSTSMTCYRRYCEYLMKQRKKLC